MALRVEIVAHLKGRLPVRAARFFEFFDEMAALRERVEGGKWKVAAGGPSVGLVARSGDRPQQRFVKSVKSNAKMRRCAREEYVESRRKDGVRNTRLFDAFDETAGK